MRRSGWLVCAALLGGACGGDPAGSTGSTGVSGSSGQAGSSSGQAGAGASGSSGQAGAGQAGSGPAGASGSGASGAGGAAGAGQAGSSSGAGGDAGGAAGAGGVSGAGGGGAGAAGQGQATTMRVHYPVEAGHTLTIRGSAGGLSWDVGAPMEGGADDVWTFSSESVGDLVEWKPLLDGEWSRGPNYVAKAGGVVDVYPHFYATKGQVDLYQQAFVSKHLEAPRDVWVYLPPTYLENARARFPVVYMHDGQNLFDAAMAFGGNEWQVDEAFDAAAESGAIREAIVVGVGNTSDRIYEYTPVPDSDYLPSGGGDDYLALLVDELKPVIDAGLRTTPEREVTAVVGSSLGGLISSYAGVKRPEVFGLVGALSPSTWWADTYLIGQVATVAGQPARALRVYVDSGDSGDSMDGLGDTAKLAAQYEAVGYQPGVDLRYVVQPGASHSEFFWAQRFPGAMEFLLGPRPDSGSKPF